MSSSLLRFTQLKLAAISEVQLRGEVTLTPPTVLPLVCKSVAKSRVNFDEGS